MQEQDGLNPGERELELAMKSLVPAAGRIDPIAAAFAAGRRSNRRQLGLWRAAAVFMLLIGAGVWLMPARHNVVVIRSSVPAVGVQSAAREPLAPQSMQALQEAVNEKGLDGLPATNIPIVHILRAGDVF